MSVKILITDGNTRSALAATRSLGKRGLHVVVGGDTKRTLAGASRFCRETITYPSPDQDPEGFIAAIRSECLTRGISVIFPMTEISTSTVLRRRDRLSEFRLPFADFATFEALSDKWNLLKLAQRLSVSIPETHFVEGAGAVDDVLPR